MTKSNKLAWTTAAVAVGSFAAGMFYGYGSGAAHKVYEELQARGVTTYKNPAWWQLRLGNYEPRSTCARC